MNILVLPHAGGSYNSLRPETEIYIGLAKAGHNITILTNTEREYVPRFIEHGIQVIHSNPRNKLNLTTIRLIRKAIKENNIDIVYATHSRNITNAAFACIGLNVKLVVYRGTTGGLYRRDPSTFLSILHPRVNGVVCVSNAVTNYVKKRTWDSVKNNVVTIYKGHDLAWYDKPETDISEFGTDKKKFNVVCVANARPHKGLKYFIGAAKDVAHLKDIHFVIVGEKVSEEPYLSLIEESGMKERIHVTGYRNDAPEIIAACDVLVLPSIREGLPRVVLESLAYGTPVITSANPGSMEIINDGENGFVVPLRDSKGISEKIIKLHNEPDTLKQLSLNAPLKIENTFSSQTTVEKYIEYFESLLK